ncbi:MAG: sugar O-acetyltransferase [Eubacteriales bacterium]|nr:sugar O-acetyltransferase [Eubacteriales bacterium]
MNHKERMLKGLPYLSNEDGLFEDRQKAKVLCHKINTCDPLDVESRNKYLKELIPDAKGSFYIEPPFRCDYGYNICIGNNFYANYNLIVLDCARVIIGDNVLVGPNVCITTAGHPIHHLSRRKYEYADEVKIGNNVWIGANVVLNPGVKIGDNCVIGSGSVVTKDIPSDTVAVGNPCKVLREITDDDREYYYKDRKFDIEDY